MGEANAIINKFNPRESAVNSKNRKPENLLVAILDRIKVQCENYSNIKIIYLTLELRG